MENTLLDAIALINKFYTDIPISARIAYIGWILYVSIYYFLRRFEKHNGLLKKRRVKATNKPYVMYFLVGVSAVLSVYFSANGITFNLPVLPGLSWEFLGFGLMSVGLIFAMEARACLNGFWGGGIFHYDNPADQALITKGTYSFVRHPIYFGQLLLTLGTVLLVNNYWFLFLPILTFLSNWSRARNEEMDLHERFGEEFESYKNKSDFMIPIIW